MKRKTITVDEVMALNPCEGYDRDRVEALFDGRKRATVPDIVGADIPARDRVCLLLQNHFFADDELRLFARWCAWQVRDQWAIPGVMRRFLLTGEVLDGNEHADEAAAAARESAAAAAAASESVAAAIWSRVAATSAAEVEPGERYRQLGALQLLAGGRLTVETEIGGT